MSLSWLTYAAEAVKNVEVLTGASARCGDFVYNLSNGTYSINQLASLLRTVGSDDLTGAINSVGSYVHDTTLSDIACTLETNTGISAPVACALAGTGAYAGYKGLQYAYRAFEVKTPAALIQAIIEKFGPQLLNVDFKKIAQVIDGVLDSKAQQALNEIADKLPQTFATLSEEDKKKIVATTKQQSMNSLPKQLESHREEVTAAIAQSQVPAPLKKQASSTNLEAQQANAIGTSFDLANALSTILFNHPITQPNTKLSIKM